MYFATYEMPPNDNPQGRYWILTIPLQDWSVPSVLPAGIQWLKGQAEESATGYKHWQFVISLPHKIRREALKRSFCQSAHIELTRSQAAEAYCGKEDTRIPGTEFEVGMKAMKRNSKIDWAVQKQLALQGKMDDIDPSVFIQYYSTLKMIHKDYMTKPADLDAVCGVWIWGPPGVGKSRKARLDYPGAYDKMCNKWWCGYQGEEVAMLDDFDKNHRVLGHHLKRWADRYSFIAEAKNSALNIRPTKIVVTSNYSIEEIFEEDPTLAAAIRRRFTVQHMTEPWGGIMDNFVRERDVEDVASGSGTTQ